MSWEDRRRREMEQFEAARVAKAKVNKAFAALRKQGIVARQALMCCNSCAWSQVAADVEKTGETPKGVVLYSKQGGFFDGHPEARRTKVKKLALSYGPLWTPKGEIGLPAKEVGEMVRAALEAEGLHVEWDGNPDKTIYVDPCPNLWSHEPRTRFEKVA